MQISVTTTKGLERRVEVAVPEERLADEIDQRLKRLSRTARLKGFRPGKVPYAVVRAQFGPQVQAEAVDDLMRRTFAEAIEQEKLRPATGARLEPISTELGQPLRYAAVFEVLPEIELKPFDTIEIERPVAAITAEDVDAMLENMRRQQQTFSPVERAAREGDRVTLDFVGRIDGEEFAGGTGEGVQITLGAHRVLPEIEQAAIGMAAGQEKQVPLRFPDDYAAATLAGKQAEFTLKVAKVEEAGLPPLDEAFARAYGVAEGIEALRSEVQRNMEREAETSSRVRAREQLLDALYRDNSVELPQALVHEQIHELQAAALRRSGSRDPSQLPSHEAFEPAARRHVALGLILTEITRSHGLQLDRERVQQRLEQICASYPDPQEARRRYLASQQAMEQVESQVIEDQALELAMAKAQVHERPVSFSELTGFGQKAA